MFVHAFVKDPSAIGTSPRPNINVHSHLQLIFRTVRISFCSRVCSASTPPCHPIDFQLNSLTSQYKNTPSLIIAPGGDNRKQTLQTRPNHRKTQRATQNRTNKATARARCVVSRFRVTPPAAFAPPSRNKVKLEYGDTNSEPKGRTYLLL